MTADNVEPPYWAVIFTSGLAIGQDPEYDRTAALMEELAESIPGYLGIESTRNLDGVGITVSYWATLDAIALWRDHPAHLEAKSKGRTDWYEWYELRVARVERATTYPLIGET